MQCDTMIVLSDAVMNRMCSLPRIAIDNPMHQRHSPYIEIEQNELASEALHLKPS
jgi:hypothetical protein